MPAGNLEPIAVGDSDIDYDDYVGVLEGGIVGRSERMLTAYTDLETRFCERFEGETADETNRFLESSDTTESFRAGLDETYDEELYPVLADAGETDIGGYAEFQDTMRTLSELNYVKLLATLENARHGVSRTRNHSSNALSLLNEVGEILTDKGYNHSTKEPITERFSEAKRELKRANHLRQTASATVKRCYFYLFTADLVREKYDIGPEEFQYVDVEESITNRVERVRSEYMRQDKQIRKGHRSLKHKIAYIKKHYDV
ncbi:MAG: hypothetical protein ABEI77_00035 [Halorientalis sp.]